MFQPQSIERLNAIVLPVLRTQIDTLGETESGAYNFYASRLRNGSIVSDYEVSLTKALMERGLAADGVHEIGAGLGQLPILLALNGIASAAIELDRRRAATATLMLEAIRAADPGAGALITLVHAAFPVDEAVLTPGQAVLVSTNLVFTTTAEARLAICRAMTRYRLVVVDVDRLFEKRLDDDGRRASFALMADAGFDAPEPFLDLRDSGRYFVFRPKAGAEREPAAGDAFEPSAHVGARIATPLAAPAISTASLADARRRLSAMASKRGVTRLVYFHTDHFEPWRSFDGRRVLGGENARDLAKFADDMSRLEYARKLTLFIKPHVNFALRRGDDMVHATPDDDLGFIVRTPAEIAAARAALDPIIDQTGAEFQLHVHHENYTSNATNTQAGTDIGRYLATAKGAALDSARFEFAVRTKLDVLQQEVGCSFARWFFIHGHWALNASDDRECRIVDEIRILRRLGCLGDFTCPAGRAQVDPRHLVPYLAKPVDVCKGYDTLDAEPIPLAGAGQELADSRFLVWASAIKHGATSIDHSSEFVRRRGNNLEKAAGALLEQSFLHAGTLYVKTHAHAMHAAYFDGRAEACFPHCYGVTRTLLNLTFDAAAGSGAEIAFLTASEVYDELVNSPVKADDDLMAAFQPSVPSRLRRLLHWS